MLTTSELLTRLRERGIRNVEVARALEVSASRIAELYAGKRSLKLDEAAKLVAVFGLEDAPMMAPDQVLAALIKHVGEVLGKPIDDGNERLGVLTDDLKAFAQFQTDPAMRSCPAAAEGFFRGLRVRRGD